MFNLSSIQHIQQFIALFIAYVPTVTIIGFIEAWIITLFGDDTAEENGFLTLNPMRHIDILGVVFLFLINWGFGQRVPYNPMNIKSPYRNLKFVGVVFTRPIVSLLLAILAMFALLFITGGNIITALSNASAIKLALINVIIALLNLNIIYVAIYYILGLATILVEFLLPDAYNRSLSVTLIVSVVFPMILFLALQPYIQPALNILLHSIINLF